MGIFDRFIKKEKEQEHEEATIQNGNYNFQYLSNLVQSQSNISLDADIALEFGEEELFIEGIEIANPGTVIDGCGHTIDAGGKTRIFNVSTFDITIKNVVIKNGFKQFGGAILVSEKGELTLESANFDSNSAELGGGAIDTMGKTKILDCTFKKNASKYGGAVYQDFGNVEIRNSKFLANRSDRIGGAIVNSVGYVKVYDSTFTKNSAVEQGGAIVNSEGTLELFNSKFKSNTSENGAAIVTSYKFTNENCEFEKNLPQDIEGWQG